MHAPVISKIRFYEPNLKKTPLNNKNHLIYIATRPGSRGLFGNIDTKDINKAAQEIYLKSQTKTPVYRGMLSLREDDAKELGYTDPKKWKELITKQMPAIAEKWHFPIENLEWVAAVHMERGHPHVHYMFWRKDNKPVRAYIPEARFHQIRGMLSREIFQEEHEKHALEKTMYRDLLRDLGKETLEKMNLKKIEKELKRLERPTSEDIPPHLSKKAQKNLARKMAELIQSLPAKGRITYKLVTPEVKAKVDEITKILLEHPELKKAYHGYISAAEQMTATYSPTRERRQWSMENAEKDLMKRMGNIILRNAKDIRYQFKQAERAGYDKNRETYLQSADSVYRGCFQMLQGLQSAAQDAPSEHYANQGKQARKEAALKNREQPKEPD